MKGNIAEAKRSLKRLRAIIAKNPPAIFKMSKEEVIKTLRRTRETIWEEKIALHH